MNSSGIKRGLAAGAVAALAVTGLPFLASSASAVGEGLTVLTSGPVRNGGDLGGLVVLSTTGITATDIDSDGNPANGLTNSKLKIIGTDLTSSPNTPAQSVEIVGGRYIAPVAPATTGTLLVNVKTTTPADGANVSYALYLDNAGAENDTVDASESRVQVTATTSGAPTSVDVTPASQSAPADVYSDAYTGTLKDSAGRTTQLTTGENLNIGAVAGTPTISVRDEPSNPSAPAYGSAAPVGTPPAAGQTALAAARVPLGTFGFKAKDTTTGTKTIPVTVTGTPSAVPAKSVSLVVTPAVTGLTEADLDVVTGADTWNGFGGGAFGAPGTSVRVDQSTIKLDIADDNTATPKPNANATISVTFTGTGGVTFGGKASTTVTTTLDAMAKGSVSATPDAASINENGVVTVTSPAWTGNLVLNYDRATASSVTTDAKAYNTKIGSPTAVTVTVKDQFGNPIGAPAQVSITRSGRPANAGTTARQTVDASGKATFNLPDAGTAAGTENLDLSLFDDQFDASATTFPGVEAVINYSAAGTGPDFSVTGATADAAATPITPLYDSNAGVGDSVEIAVDGGTANGSATFSVDGGALLLSTSSTPAETNLTQGSASETVALDGNGDGSVRVVGTKFGDVTVTIVSGGVTKTVKVRVQAPTVGADATARNIELEGPEKANANDVVTFTATVTDAFGNAVAGVTSVNPLLTGPAEILSTSGASNAAGEITYQVQLTNSANSPVTLTVRGVGSQFGASANYLTDADDNATPPAAPNAPGLSASTASDAVTISDVKNIEELEKAVEDAQAKVDAATLVVQNAQGDLKVAKAERSVAQSNVKAAKKDLKQAKKKKKGVKAAQAALRNAKGDLKIAKTKVASAQTKVDNAKVALGKAQEQLAAAEAELEAAQS